MERMQRLAVLTFLAGWDVGHNNNKTMTVRYECDTHYSGVDEKPRSIKTLACDL